MTTILELVGNTPLLGLKRLSADTPGVDVYVKAEFLNPSGSVKDRAARAMILDGIERGILTQDKTLIDATSGNTGIAFSMFGAALGYNVKLFLPANTGSERKRIMKNYGAQIVETSPLEGSDGAFLAVRDEAGKHPERYFYPDQYNNPANPLAHFHGTGVEIWNQTGGRVSHFIASMGTSGTFMGTSRRLKQENPNIKTIAIQPASPLHGIEGTKHMATTIKPGVLDESIQDGVITVSTEEAYAMARRLAKEEGLFAGISSGANVAGAIKLAQTLPSGSVVVTILCDGGLRYISEEFWKFE